jgi:DNA replication protein DnaC
MESVFNAIVENIAGEAVKEMTDYIGEDGFLHCGVCHEPKEAYMFPDESIPVFDLPGFCKDKKRPSPCACRRKQIEEEEAEERRKREEYRIEELKRKGLTDAKYQESTFQNDDGKNPEASRTCKEYVEKFEQLRNMAKGSGGLILYGAPGGGKTYMASAIANGLIEKGISVIMTTAEKLSSEMSANYGENRASILQNVASVSLLILDDFGIERETKSTVLNLYEIVNQRYNAGKPMIITTNMTLQALKDAKQINQQRIFGRIVEMCPYAVKVETYGRRQDIAREKYLEMKSILDSTKGA